jgi:hypothetical protein
MHILLALMSDDNPCAKMDCASGILGFAVAFIIVGIYNLGKSEGQEEKPKK